MANDFCAHLLTVCSCTPAAPSSSATAADVAQAPQGFHNQSSLKAKREKARERARARRSERECVRESVCVCKRDSVCERVCVCEREREMWHGL